ncbi:pyridoxamine 5-phosphate oxidase, putative [Ectocarpus siliculosus]|uniref:NAD(P)H-hydrate epimerase n=1 Tax=Ectocarpus siliculosus TaxID=2880 RepID=D8LL91_ECTSI|nr:pyridoxamine 5-phosphate oxidase, putative [Ectocarpus siliculosus]|eukprot:CBN77089.1 pyridoxamine 5-phosphate oxidase, putative [Ectocarpus siliculosus]
MASSQPPPSSSGISLLTAEDSAALDADLMSTPGFSIDQLMELAGLSVACAIAKVYPPPSRVLIVCGPGNNGGDGLVAARHLWQFGYRPTCLYPKPTARQLFTNLVEQCKQLDIEFLPSWEAAGDLGSYDVVLDAMFGFGFKGDPRPPFDTILKDLSKSGATPVVSVDVPSGWSVDEGDSKGGGLKPEMLISLTAPKLSARFFEGPHHFLGGRFVPPGIASKYSLELPAYPGSEQCVRLEEWGQQRRTKQPQEPCEG